MARRRLERRIPEGQLCLLTSVNANLGTTVFDGDDPSCVDVAALREHSIPLRIHIAGVKLGSWPRPRGRSKVSECVVRHRERQFPFT